MRYYLVVLLLTLKASLFADTIFVKALPGRDTQNIQIADVGDNYIGAKPHVSTRFEINGEKLTGLGHDWQFEGAQDDPINDHETHLKVQEYSEVNQIRLKLYAKNNKIGSNEK